MRTLVFHDGALGDVLLSLSCINVIGKQAARLDVVCRDDVGGLLRSSGVVQGAFSSDSCLFSSLYAGCAEPAAREMLGRYDRVYVFTRLAGGGLAANIAGVVPDARIITTVPPAEERMSVAEFRAQQLSDAVKIDPSVRLHVPAPVRREAREVLSRAGLGERVLIVLHPGSGGKHKCWPLERYLTLAERLVETAGAFLLFLSGPAEAPPVRERIDRFIRDRTSMAHIADADLVLVAGFLAESGLYIGNDSGVSHLAAAVGVHVITLYGPTDAELWRPCGESVRVIAASTMEDIAVDAVLAAAMDIGKPQETLLS